MKNIHVLPTDKPSRFCLKITDRFQGFDFHPYDERRLNTWYKPQHIYITSSKEIKEGDIPCWVISDIKNAIPHKLKDFQYRKLYNYKKIILTTDQDLIKDGVQAIDDEFLEWFVKNPTCEKVEVESFCKHGDNCPSKGAYDKQYLCDVGYKIIIPQEEPKCLTKLEIAKNIAAIGIGKEEPKQETLEEVCYKVLNYLYPNCKKEMSNLQYTNSINSLKYIAKWVLEEKIKQDKNKYSDEEVLDILFTMSVVNPTNITEWFEQFKKK